MRFLLLTFCIPFLAYAQNYDLKAKPSLRVTKEKKSVPVKSKPSRPAVVEAPIPTSEPEIKWGGEIGYSLRTDLADQIRPRLYTHALGVAYGFTHTPSKFSLVAAIDAAFESTGERRSEILVDDDRQELFVNDFTISLGRTYSAAWNSKVALGLANEFPSSPEAQRENYNSVTSLSAGWSFPVLPKRLSLSLKSEVFYIWNSYEYSPATGDLNRQGGARLEVAGRLTLWQGWFVSAMAGSQLARFLDGTSDVNHRNAFGTGYAWERFNVSLSMSNGTYLDREDTAIWFVDEYRRMLSFGMRYSF